jgi:hypothetical protein
MSRPVSVTLLAFGVFCLAVFNLLGVINGILRYKFVSDLPIKVSPIYLIASDAFWGLLFVGLSFGLWRLRHWGRRGVLVALSLYVAQSWFNRWLLSQADYMQVTAPFAILLNTVILGLVWAVLLRRSVRDNFSD